MHFCFGVSTAQPSASFAGGLTNERSMAVSLAPEHLKRPRFASMSFHTANAQKRSHARSLQGLEVVAYFSRLSGGVFFLVYNISILHWFIFQMCETTHLYEAVKMLVTYVCVGLSSLRFLACNTTAGDQMYV